MPTQLPKESGSYACHYARSPFPFLVSVLSRFPDALGIVSLLLVTVLGSWSLRALLQTQGALQVHREQATCPERTHQKICLCEKPHFYLDVGPLCVREALTPDHFSSSTKLCQAWVTSLPLHSFWDCFVISGHRPRLPDHSIGFGTG